MGTQRRVADSHVQEIVDQGPANQIRSYFVPGMGHLPATLEKKFVDDDGRTVVRMLAEHGRRAGLKAFISPRRFNTQTAFRTADLDRPVCSDSLCRLSAILLSAMECGPEEDINQEGCGSVFMTSQIEKKHSGASGAFAARVGRPITGQQQYSGSAAPRLLIEPLGR